MPTATRVPSHTEREIDRELQHAEAPPLPTSHPAKELDVSDGGRESTRSRSTDDDSRTIGVALQEDGDSSEKVRGKDADKAADEKVMWVEWEYGDVGDPFNWPKRKKWVTAGLGCWFCFLAGLAGGAYSIGIPDIQADLGVSHELATLGLSVYPFGFGIAPLFLAPFSESFGRLPIYHATFFVHMVIFAGVGAAKNIQTVIICRFIGGCAASTGSTMAAGSIADVFRSHERGLPMSIFSLAAFAGVGAGPTCMGFVAERIGWRWIQWIQMVLAGVTFVVLVVCMRETRGTVLLAKKAERIRKETGDERWRSREEEQRVGLWALVRASSTRAVWLLVSEPIVLAFSSWIAFAWGIMWGLLSSLVLILTNVYGFSQGQAGLGFLSIIIGSLVAFAMNPIQERLYAKHYPRKGAEARLYAAMAGGILLPIGGFILAWTQGNGPWIGPLIGVAVLMCAVFQIYCSCFNYLADSYGPMASSAIAGQSFLRNMVGTAFPLFTTQMYNNLGYQWASTLMACIGAFASVLPFVLYFYGPQIRARSKIAQSIMLAEKEFNASQESVVTA